MIYTVTLNPSIDYIVEVEDLRLGDLNRMKRDLKLPGGKGINVSRVLKQLGVQNKAMGFLGGFTGRYIEDWLHEESISSDFVFVSDDTRINIKLKHGEETEINGVGPAILVPEADALLQKLAALNAEDVVILSGSVPHHWVQISMTSLYLCANRVERNSSLTLLVLHFKKRWRISHCWLNRTIMSLQSYSA